MDALINPERLPNERPIPKRGILFINPNEAHFAVQNAIKLGGRRQYLFNSNLIVLKEYNVFIAGPCIGAPMAVMVLEKLIALGANEFIVFGWCGSLTPELTCETLFLPIRGFSEEGTSDHYPVNGNPNSSEKLRTIAVACAERTSTPCQEGVIWTTDAPYRETRSKIQAYQRLGAVAVDMEFTALCTVAKFRKANMAAMYLVSDELWREKWQSAFNRKGFKKRSQKIIMSLFEYFLMI